MGNFKEPWHNKDEVLVILEAVRHGKGYFTVLSIALDKAVDIQELGELTLVRIPELVLERGIISWCGIDNDHVIGYTIYQGKERLNDDVIVGKTYTTCDRIDLRPVIEGGHETVYSSGNYQREPADEMPFSSIVSMSPNPSNRSVTLSYHISQMSNVSLKVYDATGSLVRNLVDDMHSPGYYSLAWNAKDDSGSAVSVGVYFVRFTAHNCDTTKKIILLR